MASGRRTALGVDVPTLEPDDVMLYRLSTLSACSTPAPRALRAGSKLLAALTAAATIGATSWVAGALPGAPSPFEPLQDPGQLASAGQPRTGDGIGSPQPDDDSTPGGPLSPGPPGDHPGHASVGMPSGLESDAAGGPRTPAARPKKDGPGPGDGNRSGHGKGKALGHTKDDEDSTHPGKGNGHGQDEAGNPGHGDEQGQGNGQGHSNGKGHSNGQGQDKSAHPGRSSGPVQGHDKATPGKGTSDNGGSHHSKPKKDKKPNNGKGKPGKGPKKAPPVRGKKGR